MQFWNYITLGDLLNLNAFSTNLVTSLLLMLLGTKIYWTGNPDSRKYSWHNLLNRSIRNYYKTNGVNFTHTNKNNTEIHLHYITHNRRLTGNFKNWFIWTNTHILSFTGKKLKQMFPIFIIYSVTYQSDFNC